MEAVSATESHQPASRGGGIVCGTRPARLFEMLPGSDLPLFKGRAAGAVGDDIWYYAPGYLSLVPPDRSEAFEADLLSASASDIHAIELRRHAAEAEAKWAARQTAPFAPVCLTVYPSNRCNSACGYCYSAASRSGASPKIGIPTVRSAADLVAANCLARFLPLTVVLHGGGEPTLDRRLADGILDATEAAASRRGLGLFRYVATNGILSAGKAFWLVRRFDLIGLSCDGPDWIQDRQRPLPGGRRGSPMVESTAHIVREAGKPLHVRVTITPASVAHQSEIAEYICSRLRPSEIHVEPFYAMGKVSPQACGRFVASQAEEYVAGFLDARAVAQRYGVEWSSSQVRPDEVHGPYCEVFRDVLHVVPGGAATGCFGVVDSAHAREVGMDIGGPPAGRGEFVIDVVQVRDLRRTLDLRSPACDECFNRYHCARGCPEVCPAERSEPAVTFRCRVEQMLAYAYLSQTAHGLLACTARRGEILGGPVTAHVRPGARS